ncbi:MAG: hypothetical protein HC872_01585 [Gammaproteobacteria bacterium]|nr:hypothetical protein [Gammaproteobacteria bacterium]
MSTEVRRGWLLILASGVGVACSSVVLPYYSIGALVGPLTQEFAWSRADVQFAILFSSGLGVLTARWWACSAIVTDRARWCCRVSWV